MAYLMYKAKCVEGWAFWVWLVIPLLVLLYLMFMLLVNETKNKSIMTILAIVGLILIISGFIFKIWFFVKMLGCDDINIYLKAVFIVLIFVSAIINYYNKQ
jgi:hypothetical protein